MTTTLTRLFNQWSIHTMSAEDRFWLRVEPEPNSGCWLWIGARTTDGYGRFNVGGKRHMLAHRFAFGLPFARGGSRKGDVPCVLHHCDTPACVRPDHLFLGTRADNMADAVRKGRIVRSAAVRLKVRLAKLRTRKLSLEQEAEILRRVAAGEAQAAVGREYDMSPSGIHYLVVQGRKRGMNI
jgi:hypothetical protein